MGNISAVISAFNEEKNIEECLKSLKWVDEIIVIDNQSTDATAEIAKKMGATVHIRPNEPMLNKNKNYGFTKATSDWILNLDADERVTQELEREIKDILKIRNSQFAIRNSINGYWIPRKNIIFGKWIKHSLWWPDEQLRLFKKGNGKFPEKHVHEYLHVDGETKHLKNPLTHYNYISVSQFIYKVNEIYTKNETKNFIDSGGIISWEDTLKWPVFDFLKNYFALKGYKDGLHGLVLNLLQAFYTEVTFAKIWEKQGFPERDIKPEEIVKITKKLLKDLNYWLTTVEIEETNNPIKRQTLKIKRKLGRQ
jgi:glycosyltransferase involved in cell wall biosynthesis